MNIIPLVYVKDGKLLDGKDGNQVSIYDLFKRVEKDMMLYVLDLDGIEHNNPSLDLYQKLTEHCILWIDDGPRRLDDVMDTIMAGATNFTLRNDLWPDIDFPGVQELTDDDIYIAMSVQQKEQHQSLSFFSEDIGIVLFNDASDYTTFSKDVLTKHKLYLYTQSTDKAPFWNEQGVTGILIDLNKKEGKT
jgi:uncharacterized protein related to proFAR isomerase